MLNSIDFSGRPFHFLGIGGIGMSAIAHILAHRNLPVSGSDLKLSHITDRLTAMGAHVFSSQDAENLSYFHVSATTLKALSERPAQQRKKLRPIRPKPLIATLITASCPLLLNTY